jgi:hypothetical protein
MRYDAATRTLHFIVNGAEHFWDIAEFDRKYQEQK